MVPQPPPAATRPERAPQYPVPQYLRTSVPRAPAAALTLLRDVTTLLIASASGCACVCLLSIQPALLQVPSVSTSETSCQATYEFLHKCA